MKEFVLIFRMNQQSSASAPTPAQLQERMQWLSSLVEQDKVADKGYTLPPQQARLIKSDYTVADGPHAAAKEFVSGILVIRATDIEEAVAIAKTNPVFKAGGNVEVREGIKR